MTSPASQRTSDSATISDWEGLDGLTAPWPETPASPESTRTKKRPFLRFSLFTLIIISGAFIYALVFPASSQTYLSQVDPLKASLLGMLNFGDAPAAPATTEPIGNTAGAKPALSFFETQESQSTQNNNVSETISANDSQQIIPVVVDDLADSFNTAYIAFEQGDWQAAIEQYEQIQRLDDTYQAKIINQHLITAYYNAASEAVADAPQEDTNLNVAFSYFRNVLLIEPDNTDVQEQAELLAAYLAGESALQAHIPHEAVKHLLPLYRAQPTYLGGHASQLLYQAYIDMGDLAVRKRDHRAALELFKQAKAINTADTSDVTVRLNNLKKLLLLTPMPYPANLATVQAAAQARNLPPVILSTPTPASTVEAKGQAQYATAVAVTTGTFTPVPQPYVTPILIEPSPPAQTIATEAARAVEATAKAKQTALPPATPLPYNAVIAEHVYATPEPDNAMTAEAWQVIDQANAILKGTPTPIPWHAVIITAVPTELPPTVTATATNTPIPLLVAEAEFTPTPTVTPEIIAPDQLPTNLHNKIIFLSDRSGKTEPYLIDPTNGQIWLVTQDWVLPMAQEQLRLSPDGKHQAIVERDINRILQIKIYSPEYDSTRQVTAVSNYSFAYDPAWSPIGPVIAYVSNETKGDEIYTVNIETDNIKRLTDNSWEWDKHPSWSPNGNRIVFYSNRDTGRRQLWVMDADGSSPYNLSNNLYEDWDPIWLR